MAAAPLALNLPTLIPFVVGGVLAFVFIFGLMLANRYVKVGPNEALVISGLGETTVEAGGRTLRRGYKIVRGGGTFVWPIWQRADLLSLEVHALDVKVSACQSVTGLPVNLTVNAQFKVKGDDASLHMAAEAFLSKSFEEINAHAQQILAGHLRALVGRVTVEELFREREKFSQDALRVCASDFSAVGLEVVSLTLMEVSDTQGYLEALVQLPMAVMKRDVAVKMAEFEREAAVRAAEIRKDAVVNHGAVACPNCRRVSPQGFAFCGFCRADLPKA